MSIPFEAKASEGLEHLGLKVAHQHLDQTAQQAAAGDWSYTHFLGYLLDGELEERRRRSIEVSLKFAHFPYHKRLEDFDYTAQPSIDRRLIDELIDRLTHRMHIVEITGESYRLKQNLKTTEKGETRPPAKS